MLKLSKAAVVCLSVSSTFDVTLSDCISVWLAVFPFITLHPPFIPPPPPPLFLSLSLFSLSSCLSLILKFCHGISSVDRHSLHMPPIYECDCIYILPVGSISPMQNGMCVCVCGLVMIHLLVSPGKHSVTALLFAYDYY